MVAVNGTATGSQVQADQITAAISRHSFQYRDEEQLHDGVEVVLAAAGLNATREHPLGTGRIDFLVDRVGIELKVDGTASSVERQLKRYAATGLVDVLVLVTTRVRHREIKRLLGDTEVVVVVLNQNLF